MTRVIKETMKPKIPHVHYDSDCTDRQIFDQSVVFTVPILKSLVKRCSQHIRTRRLSDVISSRIAFDSIDDDTVVGINVDGY